MTNRSGYREADDYDTSVNLWGGRVAAGLRGKRGQTALMDIVGALDAMDEKVLVSDSFSTGCGMCALGALAKARGVNMSDLELSPDEHEYDEETDAVAVGARLNIAPSMAREIMFQNDDWPRGERLSRWEFMRAWAVGRLSEANREALAC